MSVELDPSTTLSAKVSIAPATANSPSPGLYVQERDDTTDVRDFFASLLAGVWGALRFEVAFCFIQGES